LSYPLSDGRANLEAVREQIFKWLKQQLKLDTKRRESIEFDLMREIECWNEVRSMKMKSARIVLWDLNKRGSNYIWRKYLIFFIYNSICVDYQMGIFF
jgi:hypothetical protein